MDGTSSSPSPLLAAPASSFVRYYMSQTSVKAQENRQKEAQKSSAQASINAKLIDTSLPYHKIFLKVSIHAVAVFLVFTVTLSLFPAVISSIQSTAPDPKASGWTDSDKYFTQLICFLLFNCSDFVGRYITHWTTIGHNRYLLLAVSILRSVFIPLFVLCNARPDGHRHIPLVFNSDVWPIIFTLLFGLTNGYTSTLCMIFAPQQVPPDQRETASTIMAFFLSAGLLAGGALSFGWTHLITHP